jgi:hypothetical protein
MACGDDLKTQLSRYVDGELSSEERARVDEHVAACAPCRELLQIFQKNESLLSNALSTESFGNAVIESVLSEIKREAQPVEARPVEEGATEWVRNRPALPLAAAALLMIGLTVILNASHNRDLEKVKGDLLVVSNRLQDVTIDASKKAEEFEQTIRSIRMEDATYRAPERQMWAYITPQHLVVRGNFDPKVYSAFTVYRRAEGEGNEFFKKLSGDRRLESPEYIDSTVSPGHAYVYKFRAYRTAKDEDFVESLPVTMRVPRVQELGADRSVRVECVDIGYSYKIAKFRLHRVVNGRTVTEEFAVKPGERLGELREIPGFGRVDFRTNLTLERLEHGSQSMTVSYTKALLDPNGKPIIKRWNDGTEEVVTVQEEGVLSIRPNLRALFRTAGAAQPDVDLWKGSWMQVRAQE